MQRSSLAAQVTPEEFSQECSILQLGDLAAWATWNLTVDNCLVARFQLDLLSRDQVRGLAHLTATPCRLAMKNGRDKYMAEVIGFERQPSSLTLHLALRKKLPRRTEWDGSSTPMPE